MILNVRKLIKQEDIINSEGTILGLYNLNSSLYLGSLLKDGSGMIYYSTNNDLLRKYLNSEIRLDQLYGESEDLIVTRMYRNETVSFLKQDLTDLIECGDQYYKEISGLMKNRNFEIRFLGS